MDLANLEIALRPRSPWEAIDLGFTMARRWFRPLITLWLMGALPVALLLLIFFHDNIILLSLLLWWFKPLYEPPLMFWLSRSVFGERTPLRDVRRGWWKIVRPQLFANLTWRRLSTNRSFYMPVALLEGLKGKERRQRTAVLGRRQQAGTWLTIVGIHLETILEFGFLITLYYLIPEELRWFHGGSFFLSPGPIDEWIQLTCWLIAMAVFAPFYVAGGFALYLHRRSELEGWDIEINFRQTMENLTTNHRVPAGSVAAAVLCLFIFFSAPPQAHADGPSPRVNKQQIEQVLKDPLFGHMEDQHYWKYIGDVEKKDDKESSSGFEAFLKIVGEVIKGFMRGTASVGEIILWGLGLFLVAYLIYHFSRNSDWMQAITGGRGGRKRKLPTQLFGLDVRPESLPDDIATEALQHVKSGDLRQALSLLYRGTLVRLVTDYQLEIPDSATEGECLKLVRQEREENEAEYFQKLTRVWLVTAYAHIPPEALLIEQLCHDWQEVYGHGQQ
jgi:hypothetical protein